MRPVRHIASTAFVLALAAAMPAALLPSAEASRKPTRGEQAVIKRVALKRCGRPDCRFASARVSTRDRRYAWANVGGEGFSGVLLKRPRASSHRFRVVGTQGGGIGECSYWRARAPRAVLRDLRIYGLVDRTSGDTRICG